jgi:hypothetical protein
MRYRLLKFLTLLVFTLSGTQLLAWTAKRSGNWNDPSTWEGTGTPGTVITGHDIIIPAGITVNLDADIIFSGEENTFSVDGALRNTTAHELEIRQGTLAGEGNIELYKIIFNARGSITFTGSLIANIFEDRGAELQLGAITSIIDTLDLYAGSLQLNWGSNLTAMTNSTIRINSGILDLNGGILNSTTGYNVMYTGASKSTGIELNTGMLNNLYIQLADNQQTLTLSTNGLTVNGDVISSMGKFDYSGKQMSLHGEVTTVSENREVISPTGIELYPNPADDYLYVNVYNTDDTFEYNILDESGKTLMTTSNRQGLNNFDVSGLKDGHYYLKVINLNGQKVITLHFIKS